MLLLTLNSCGQSRDQANAPEKHYTHPITYTIQTGDTLGGISQKFYGTTSRWKEIARANKLDPRRLQVGQSIVIPRSGLKKQRQKGQRGKASYYAAKYEGRKTASGEIYKSDRLTAAHREYPFGTRLGVRNLKNDAYVQVRINDRGPFVKGRIIDLSYAAAKALRMLSDGTADVEITVLAD